MTKYLSYVVALLLAGTAVSFAKTPDTDAIKAKETAAWQSFKDKKADDFKKVIDKNFLGVYAEGFFDMANELDAMQKWDMKSFTIGDFKATSAGADTVISTYTVKVEGTFNGQDMTGTYNCGSVWKMEGKNWLGIFHTNIKQVEAPK